MRYTWKRNILFIGYIRRTPYRHIVHRFSSGKIRRVVTFARYSPFSFIDSDVRINVWLFHRRGSSLRSRERKINVNRGLILRWSRYFRTWSRLFAIKGRFPGKVKVKRCSGFVFSHRKLDLFGNFELCNVTFCGGMRYEGSIANCRESFTLYLRTKALLFYLQCKILDATVYVKPFHITCTHSERSGERQEFILSSISFSLSFEFCLSA